MTDSDGNEIGKLFIGGLSQATNNGSLRLYFSRFGEIDDAIVMMDNKTGRSRGFGYVKYHECESVNIALQAKPHIIDGKEVDAKQCNINMKGRNKRSLKIFVGGIGLEQDIVSIKDYFKQFGHVTDVNLMMDTNKQRHRGFAFISFDDESVVKHLINLHYVNINNKQVEIKAMEPPNFNRKLINTNLINHNSNNHNHNTNTMITQNPYSLITPHLFLQNHTTSNSDILNCHDIYESVTNDPTYNFLTNSFTPIYSAHSHPLFSYPHPHPPHHQYHQSHHTGLQSFLHPNSMRRYYCYDQQNTLTTSVDTSNTTTITTNTTTTTTSTISNYNNFASNISSTDETFQSFRTNSALLRHSIDKSSTSTHSPLSHSTTVNTTLGTTNTSNTTSTPTTNPVNTTITPKQQQHHSTMPPLILTTNQFQQPAHSFLHSNIFNFQQQNINSSSNSTNSSPSVYTIPYQFIPSHIIPFPSNSMLLQQSTSMNIHPGLICNDVFNTITTNTPTSGTTASTASVTTNTSTCTNSYNKKVMSNNGTEEQIIISNDNNNDSVSRMTPITTTSKTVSTSSTNTITTPSLPVSTTPTPTPTTTFNETIDTTDNSDISNTIATRSIDNDNISILNNNNNIRSDNITGEQIAQICPPNYTHFNYGNNTLQSTNLPLTSYYAFCSQYPTGALNTPTGTVNLQIPTNDNYNGGQMVNHVSGNSNSSISVSNQGDNPLTSHDNQSLTNDILYTTEQKLNTTKCFCHPTIFIPNGINTNTPSINQTTNLWNTPGNITPNSLIHSTYQPLTGWNFPPLGNSIISPSFTHQTSFYPPYISQNQMTIHQNDMLNQWNPLSSTCSSNSNSNSTSNDVNGNDLKDSVAATTSISPSLLLSSTSPTTLSPSVTTTAKTESSIEAPITKSTPPTSSIPISDDVMTINTRSKCNDKDISLNGMTQHNFNKIMSAKPSGDNLEGLLVNNNNINQCINDNIFCFIKSPITDLTSELIESENNEVTKSWQNNNNNNNSNSGLTNNLWNMPKVQHLSQTLPTSSTLTTETTTTLNYPTSSQTISQPTYNAYHLSYEYMNGFLSNCDAHSGINPGLTSGRGKCSDIENNLNSLNNSSMRTIINDNTKLSKTVVNQSKEESSSSILSDINENSPSSTLATVDMISAMPEKVEITEKMSTTNNKNVSTSEEYVNKTEEMNTKQFRKNNTDITNTHLFPNASEDEIYRGDTSCSDKAYKECECKSNTGAAGDYPSNHHFIENNYTHL